MGRIAEQYCKKGSKVYLEGQLQTREYTDKDGNQRRTTEVVLQRFRGELTLLDSRGSGRESFDDRGAVEGSGGSQLRPFLADGIRQAPEPRCGNDRRRYSVLERERRELRNKYRIKVLFYNAFFLRQIVFHP